MGETGKEASAEERSLKQCTPANQNEPSLDSAGERCTGEDKGAK